MPFANFKCVREVSSEDANFRVENLLTQEPGKKWKTKSHGEKISHCILELQKPVHIVGIDIGNEHSAFVEVLVSSTGCRPEDFKEILITCSFMTPFESKNSTNPNRVRCFNQEALVSSVAEEKWHLVKIVCTQPFNKHCQYGLSFLKIHVAKSDSSIPNEVVKSLVPEKLLNFKSNHDNGVSTSEEKQKNVAKFSLREESPDSESESSTALFSRWKKARQSDEIQPTTAAAIRQASATASLVKLHKSNRLADTLKIKESINTSGNLKSGDRNKNELAFRSDDEKLRRLSKQTEVESQRLKTRNEENSTKTTIHHEIKNKNQHNQKEKLSKKDEGKTKIEHKVKRNNINENLEETPGSNRKRKSSPNSRPSKKPKAADTMRYRRFNKLFEGVVLVISGIQNPDRAILRSKALAMGAKYKTDWEPGCTHLICAFKNTPKYNQVKGQGKIVKRSWIEKSFDLKKYLPWRRYALDSDEQAKPESDCEVLDETTKPTDEVFSDDSDVVHKNNNTDSGSDTDDYIETIKKKNHKNETEILTEERDVYEVTTEEEEFVKDKSTKVPLFFKDLKFFVAGDLSKAVQKQLDLCIEHYGGTVATDIVNAHYYISENIPVKELLFSGEVINPNWIFECNKMQKIISTKPFLVKNK